MIGILLQDEKFPVSILRLAIRTEPVHADWKSRTHGTC
jgi:hypothetical protein